jgi:hypothetical protein
MSHSQANIHAGKPQNFNSHHTDENSKLVWKGNGLQRPTGHHAAPFYVLVHAKSSISPSFMN